MSVPSDGNLHVLFHKQNVEVLIIVAADVWSHCSITISFSPSSSGNIQPYSVSCILVLFAVICGPSLETNTCTSFGLKGR